MLVLVLLTPALKANSLKAVYRDVTNLPRARSKIPPTLPMNTIFDGDMITICYNNSNTWSAADSPWLCMEVLWRQFWVWSIFRRSKLTIVHHTQQ